jgi:glycogen operon protein
VAFTAEVRQARLLFHVILNAYWEPLDFELPPVGPEAGRQWRCWIDTAQETPKDIVPWEQAPTVPGLTYQVEARSVVVLFSPEADPDRRMARGPRPKDTIIPETIVPPSPTF